MRFRVYSGPKGSDDVSPIAKEQMLFKELGSLDEALSWSRHVERGGRLPPLIEGDDGTQMDRRDCECVTHRDPRRSRQAADPTNLGKYALAGCDPVPLGARACRQVVPFNRDHVPVDQRSLHVRRRVHGFRRLMVIVEIGAADGQYCTQDDSEQDSHGNLLMSPLRNASVGVAVPTMGA